MFLLSIFDNFFYENLVSVRFNRTKYLLTCQFNLYSDNWAKTVKSVIKWKIEFEFEIKWKIGVK